MFQEILDKMVSKPEFSGNEQSASIIGTVIFGFFILGLVIPDSWWGVHFLNFVSPAMKTACLVLAVMLLGYSWVAKNKTIQSEITNEKKWSKTFPYILGTVAGFVFYNIPMAGDVYGNARGFQDILDTTVERLPSDFYTNLFSFELVPGNGRGGVTLIVQFISYAMQVTVYDAFKIMGAVCGVGFVVAWVWSVHYFIKVRAWQITLVLVGLTSPFLIIYFGHVETYAPVYLILFLWSLLFVLFIRTRKSALYWTLVPLLLIGVRLHTLMYLLGPAFLVATLYQFNLKSAVSNRILDFKGVFKWMYLPLFAGGIILYFFVFKDFNDPRSLSTDFKDIDRLFLPMVSPEAPLDNYNMFSPSHLLDFFNMMLFWSPPVLVLLGYVLIQKRRSLNWKLPEVNLLLLSFLLFATILFSMNPLFSMPMDWDLFCFPVPVLLLLLLLLVAQVEKEPIKMNVLSASGGLMVLCIPAFSVFLTLEQNSYRIERVGVHIYKTYYEHSSTYLLMSLKMIDDPNLYQARVEGLITELEDYALPNNDKQYAELLIENAFFNFYVMQNATEARKMMLKSMEYDQLQPRFEQFIFEINRRLVQEDYVFTQKDKQKADQFIKEGKRLLSEEKNYEKALDEFRYSTYYTPIDGRTLLFSIEALFLLKRYPEAFNFATKLVTLKFPNHQTALRIGIHTALESKHYGDALRYSEIYIENFERDELILTVNKRLEARENVGELKFLFNRGS